MAVSAGYDVNVSKLLNLTHSSRKRWNFQFNCMLFAADFYIQSQDSKMKIYELGPPATCITTTSVLTGSKASRGA